MDPAWYQPLAFAILIASCVVMGMFGAESRPGFAEGRTAVTERWFPHSRNN